MVFFVYIVFPVLSVRCKGKRYGIILFSAVLHVFLFKVTFCALLRGKNHLPYNVKSFCAKQKINRRRLKNCLAQNENPISEDGSECVRTLSLA